MVTKQLNLIFVHCLLRAYAKANKFEVIMMKIGSHNVNKF